jgi:hypothetical protein
MSGQRLVSVSAGGASTPCQKAFCAQPACSDPNSPRTGNRCPPPKASGEEASRLQNVRDIPRAAGLRKRQVIPRPTRPRLARPLTRGATRASAEESRMVPVGAGG